MNTIYFPNYIYMQNKFLQHNPWIPHISNRYTNGGRPEPNPDPDPEPTEPTEPAEPAEPDQNNLAAATVTDDQKDNNINKQQAGDNFEKLYKQKKHEYLQLKLQQGGANLKQIYKQKKHEYLQLKQQQQGGADLKKLYKQKKHEYLQLKQKLLH